MAEHLDFGLELAGRDRCRGGAQALDRLGDGSNGHHGEHRRGGESQPDPERGMARETANRAERRVCVLLHDHVPAGNGHVRARAEHVFLLDTGEQGMLGQIGSRERHVRIGMDDGAISGVHQEGVALARTQLLEPFLQRAQRQLDGQHPARTARALHGDSEHQSRDRRASAPRHHVGRSQRQPLRVEGLAQRDRGGVGVQPGLIDLLVIALRVGDDHIEAHRGHDRIALLVEEAHHVGAFGLLIDEEQRLLSRFLIEIGKPERAGGQRERIELVEQHPLHLIGERRGGLRVQAADLRAHLAAAGGQSHHRRQRERRRAGAGKQQRQFHSQTHGGIVAFDTRRIQGRRCALLRRCECDEVVRATPR